MPDFRGGLFLPVALNGIPNVQLVSSYFSRGLP